MRLDSVGMQNGSEADAAEGFQVSEHSPGTLVTALWRRSPPPLGRAADAREAITALQHTLAELATRADHLAGAAPAAGPDEAAMLAETARSLYAFLDLGEPGEERDALMRVARLERWLALRARQEPAARSSADLALWALEHYEAVVRG